MTSRSSLGLTKLNRDALLTFGTNLLVSGIGLVAGIVLARGLGPDGKGQVFAILLWPQSLAWMGSLGLENANVFNLGKYPNSGSKVFANCLSASLIFGVLVAAIGQVFIATLIRSSDPNVLFLARLCLLVVPFLLFSNYLPSLLQGSQRIDLYNLLRTGNMIFWVAPLVALALFSTLSVERAVLTWMTMIGLTIGLGVLLVARVNSLKVTPDRDFFRSSLGYGLKTHAGNVSIQLNTRLDQMLLVALLSAQQVGFYSIAVGVSTALWRFSSAFAIALFPLASSRPRDEAVEAIVRTHRIVVWVLLAGSILIFWFAPQLISVLYGKAFLPATPALRILLIGSLAFGVARILTLGLYGMGLPLYGSLGQVASLVAIVPLLAILIPRFGIMGAAAASTTGFSIGFLVVLCLFLRAGGISLPALFVPGPLSSRPSDIGKSLPKPPGEQR